MRLTHIPDTIMDMGAEHGAEVRHSPSQLRRLTHMLVLDCVERIFKVLVVQLYTVYLWCG